MISMKIKQILCGAVMAVLLLSASLFAAETIPCSVDDLDMEICLPAEYTYVFTSDMSADDPLLADWGVTKEEIFENDSVYLEAFSEDRSREVILSMIRTDWSKAYYDFNNLDDEELESLAEFCLVGSSSAVEMEYTEYGLFDGNGQARFLRAFGTFANEDTQGSSVQYVTVLNGNAYTVTFNYYGAKLTEEQKAESEEIVSSVLFRNVNEKNGKDDTAFYVVWILILIVVIGILLAVIRTKKYSIRGTVGENGGEGESEKAVSPSETARPAEDEKDAEDAKE